MNEHSYTTEEIATMLKVSKLTVYDLIKKGELPAYRVGKQMRVDSEGLNMYKQRNRMSYEVDKRDMASSPASNPSSIIISGQDMCLDLLGSQLEATSGIKTLRSNQGSLNSLISMYQGRGDIVSVHLFDGQTGQYNLPYIKRILTGRSYIVVNLICRQAGFYVQKHNPKQLYSWKDLHKKNIKLVNREIGAGARILLDEQLDLHNISRESLIGYQHEETSHLSVASVVKQGKADVGVGIEKAAGILDVDFVPLIEERYDLVILKTTENQSWIHHALSLLRSPEFKQELEALGGYSTNYTGQIMYEQ
ncbi:substrate-binding domain-containing protein [Alkalicoccobacillus porphyridii]|uniref:Helix-turn-helix domain-containing protein n=1 Tax=Alkalicoccobacillus porphyridii TaxID=2597270 RepID=A0A553ZWY4_9BACI|nr:helix-turn-helix transcriptional regulator [Alkalicoccobacillus porphyridii]TSB45967.1 helix-turn-helix domain-containing protein [Alkalicoccobacillus porphyridii]